MEPYTEWPNGSCFPECLVLMNESIILDLSSKMRQVMLLCSFGTWERYHLSHYYLNFAFFLSVNIVSSWLGISAPRANNVAFEIILGICSSHCEDEWY